ncbi:MAG: pilus assembly protein [Sphingomonadales bacterium]|nr:pilus assembly protein [Sphingomonadales bacterium]
MRKLKQLRRDETGAYMIELALILPAFLLLMMGIFDIGVQMYAKAVLSGAVEEAARASTLESNNADQAAVDNRVRQAMGTVAPYASIAFQRLSYNNFSDVAEAEAFTDRNNNGVRDPGECFEDANANGTWDSDRGTNGQGGADDVVLYRVTLSYDRLFPLWRMLGEPQRANMRVVTTLRNQPFTNQTDATVAVCT